MNKYERIKNMSIDEMEEFFNGVKSCHLCIYSWGLDECSNSDCKAGILKWLLAESEEE